MPADISQANTGMFVNETYSWDISRIESLDLDPALKETLIRLYRNTNSIAIAVNQKETAIYPLAETVTNQQWFPNPNTSAATPQQPSYRGNWRYVLDFGALPNAATKSVPHGLTPTANWTWTKLEAYATDPVTFAGLQIPFASPTLNENIKITIDATNVNITTAINYSAYTRCLVVIEMLKN